MFCTLWHLFSRFKKSIIRDSCDSHLTHKNFAAAIFYSRRSVYISLPHRGQTENVGVPIDYVTARGCYGQGAFSYLRVCNFSYSERRAAKQDTRATRCKSAVLFFVVPLFPTVSWDNDDLWWKPAAFSRVAVQRRSVSRRDAHATSHRVRTRAAHVDENTLLIYQQALQDSCRLGFLFYQPVNMHENDDWTRRSKNTTALLY